ncbi:MAG TPA: helix-turn-helix transcriptional regulator [Polyangiaceae bacterium]|jgi:DNA-binding NarL/FixJ family response regulator|nr:helix-turn-helix transcriptional regulator [Polyangiaceae bacterium]
MSDETHTSDPEKSFRTAAINASTRGGSNIDCVTLWNSLVAGRSIIADEFFTQERSFLAIRRESARQRNGLATRNLEILERILLGTEPKVVAYDRSLATSTIACALRHALDTIGLHCIPSKVPLLLVRLVHAARSQAQIGPICAVELEYGGARYQILSCVTPEQQFAHVLSPAERSVMRMRVQGHSHREIAARRRTSPRTVANQVAAVFQRLGISGRSDLMGLLARC